jgi:Uma2 family endonuclease
MAFFKTVHAEQFTDDQMIFPAPDLIVEILSKSTAKHDRTLKKDDYAAHGIPEYWIIDPVKKQVEQYLLVSESATSYMPPFIHTIVDDIESRIIEGFKIPVAALFDEQANLAALQQLLKAN